MSQGRWLVACELQDAGREVRRSSSQDPQSELKQIRQLLDKAS